MGLNTGSYRALVVDDSASQRMFQAEILREKGFVVEEAGNGEEAVRLVADNDYDVILMDKNMPVMDGDEACHQIRHTLKKTLVPICMVTASNTDEELEKSLKAGATDFICKPFSETELCARVMRAAQTKRLTDQLDSAEALMFALARMVEAKDNHTGDHCSRLQHLAQVFGRKLGLSDEDLLALVRGGVLHDIGKLGIPDEILLKAGPLTDEEWEIMKTHSLIGASLCNSLSSMRATLPIILHHHEAWNGSGYPHGLSGEEIPYLARVFQILDIYDALASERPYKKAFSREKVVEILQEESDKGLRDPALTAAFIEILQQEPESLTLPDDFDEDKGVSVFKQILNSGAFGRRRSAA